VISASNQASKVFQPQMHADARGYTGAASKRAGNALISRRDLTNFARQWSVPELRMPLIGRAALIDRFVSRS
jgi:hypothetical protein